MNCPLVLASGSAIRATILANAGLAFTAIKPAVDEDALKAIAREDGESLEGTALRLARAKALDVDAAKDAYVLGSDQILGFEDRGYDKPADMDAARERLAMLQGRSHNLINGVCIVKNGEIVFERTEVAQLYMRAMTPAEIDAYLEAAGEEILSSVGAYQVERLGARLFTRIDGDYFTVLGLSLYPVLEFLRLKGAIDF